MSERPLVDPLWAETVNRYWRPDDLPEDLLDELPPEQADLLRRRQRRWPGGAESRKAIAARLGSTPDKVTRLEHRARHAVIRLAYERACSKGLCPVCGGTGRAP